MIDGHFIVIEGIDGSGTTTQCSILADRLTEKGLPVHTTREPSDGPIGVLIRQVLTGRVVVSGRQGARPFNWATMATLFAADRLDHLEAEVIPNLTDGVTVICDRYDHSSVAYQTVSGGGGEDISELGARAQPTRQASRPDARARCRPRCCRKPPRDAIRQPGAVRSRRNAGRARRVLRENRRTFSK